MAQTGHYYLAATVKCWVLDNYWQTAIINCMRQHAARLESEIDQLYSQRSAIRLG